MKVISDWLLVKRALWSAASLARPVVNKDNSHGEPPVYQR